VALHIIDILTNASRACLENFSLFMIKEGDFTLSQRRNIEFPLQRPTNHNAM
jgi:hypothetical protein